MYKIVIGNISEARAADWFCKDENPYAVWEGAALAEEICYVDSWRHADMFLRDHVDVDWGSFAWKANKVELIQFFESYRWDTSQLHKLESNVDYAVVFLESAGEF